MEDLLTSNVFGLMQYLHPQEALIPFLAGAVDSRGVCPLASLSANTEVRYEFWPSIQEAGCIACEPDLLLRLTDNQRRWIIFIEAKYLSGKSSEEDDSIPEPYDQLAREWDNLAKMAKREAASPLLVYVTADVGLPRPDLEVSKTEYLEKRKAEKVPFTCAWVSWRRISTVFQNAGTVATRDLYLMANRLGLHYFQSISRPDAKPLMKWGFDSRIHWRVPGNIAEMWRYTI